MVAAIAEAVIGPNPGMLISRRAVSSFCAIFTIVRSSRAIASSRFRSPSRPGSVEGKDTRVPSSLSNTDAHELRVLISGVDKPAMIPGDST